MSTVFTFLQEEIELYQQKQALKEIKNGFNRVSSAIKCIKKLKNGKTKMYLVKSLIEAKILIECCVKRRILNELLICDKNGERITYNLYNEQIQNNGTHPSEYRTYIRVWKGFTNIIDPSKPINKQLIVYLKKQV